MADVSCKVCKGIFAGGLPLPSKVSSLSNVEGFTDDIDLFHFNFINQEGVYVGITRAHKENYLFFLSYYTPYKIVIIIYTVHIHTCLLLIEFFFSCMMRDN